MSSLKKKKLSETKVLSFFLNNRNVGALLLKILLLIVIFEANAFFWGYLYDRFFLYKYLTEIALWILFVGVVEIVIIVWAIVRMEKKAK